MPENVSWDVNILFGQKGGVRYNISSFKDITSGVEARCITRDGCDDRARPLLTEAWIIFDLSQADDTSGYFKCHIRFEIRRKAQAHKGFKWD